MALLEFFKIRLYKPGRDGNPTTSIYKYLSVNPVTPKPETTSQIKILSEIPGHPQSPSSTSRYCRREPPKAEGQPEAAGRQEGGGEEEVEPVLFRGPMAGELQIRYSSVVVQQMS